ncbi:hypothetical protein [Geodermatophilus sp. CPCC 205506]|uniref:hypothetical protein n=1 Tax=Geodermatophilus sp. CPCC 205506 TaxID=2936596 RepID=UPI003EEC33C7
MPVVEPHRPHRAAPGAFVAPGRSLVWGAGWATAAGCLPAAVAGATVLGAAAGPVLGALMTLAAVLTGRWLSADLPPAGGATPWDEDAVRRGPPAPGRWPSP